MPAGHETAGAILTGNDLSQHGPSGSPVPRRWGVRTVVCHVDLGAAVATWWSSGATAENHRTRWRGPDTEVNTATRNSQREETAMRGRTWA